MEKTNASVDRTFIVVEADPIVSMDLMGMLKFAYANCSLALAAAEADAEKLIKAATGPVCVILNSELVSKRVLTVLRECVARGGQALLIGKKGDLDFPVQTIEFPFNSDMIIDLLTDERSGHGA